MLLLTKNASHASGGQQKAMVIRDECPRCQSPQHKKNGHIHNGKQNHQCHDCGRQFVDGFEQNLVSADTRALIEHLEELGIESVELVREGSPPSGAKVVEPVSLGGLAIKVLPAALPALIGHVRDRLLFGDNKVKIKTQVGDRSLEVEYSPQAISPDELKSLVATLTEALTGPTAERMHTRVDSVNPAENTQ
jgi:hypothetical protein